MATNGTAISRCRICPRGADEYLEAIANHRRPTLSGADLPALQVFLLSEDYSPDGDANVGVPRYIVDAGIGISVVRGFGDPVVTDGDIDADVDAILNALLRREKDPGSLAESAGTLDTASQQRAAAPCNGGGGRQDRT